MALVFGIANKKGGVGKSSIAHLFAITSSNDPISKKVLVIDASENKLLTYLNAYNQQKKYDYVKSSLTDIPNVLATKAFNYELVLIDFPVNSELDDFKTAALCCDNFIIPTGVGIMDQIATKDFLTLIDEVVSLRNAAGYTTKTKVLVSNVVNEGESNELYVLLDKQGVAHFEFPLLNHPEIGISIEKGLPVMDYITEGIGWTEPQEIFHKVFIEFHSELE